MNILLFFLFFLHGAFAETPFTITNSTIRERGKAFELTEYQSARPPVVTLPSGSRVVKCVFYGKSCSGNPIVLKIDGIHSAKAQQIHLDVQYELNRKKNAFRIYLFPEKFPRLEQTGSSAISLPLIFSVSSLTEKTLLDCTLFILGPKGELRFYRTLENQCHDFRPHQIGEKTYYSYAIANETINYVGHLGSRVILDENFNEVKRIGNSNDSHEFLLLSPDHWVGFEFRLGRLSSGKVYLDKRLREWKNGELILDWGTSDLLKQFGSEAASNIIQTRYNGEIVAEFFHMNSIQRIGDRGFVVGLGHDGVGFLDRKTKRLSWVFGGLYDEFQIPIEQHPLFNHTPIWDEKSGELVLFSNRSWGVVGISPPRILLYKIDPDHKKLVSFQNLRTGNEFVYAMGSVKKTGDHLSIGFGSKNVGRYDFIEMDLAGKESWKIELDPGRTVYRFYREPYGE